MFRTTHIRSKLAVALAIPLVALVAVAGFEVYAAAQDVEETRSQTELATSSIGPGSLVIRLQDERNRAAIDLIGLGDAAGLPVATNEEARELTDAAVAGLQVELEGRGAEVSAAFSPAWDALEGLDDLRADIDAYSGPMDLSNDEFGNEVFTRYTAIVESFFDATSTVALAVDGAALRNGVEIVDAAARMSEMRARIVRSVVLAVVTGTTDAPAVGQEVASLLELGRGFDDDIRANATGPYAGIADATFADPDVVSFNRQVEAFLAGGDVSITDMLGAVKSVPDIGYLGLRSQAADVLGSEADRIEGDAVTRERTFGAIALGALLVALIATWLASRSITSPLRSLQAQAEDMARTSLPGAVRKILDTPPGEDVVIPDVEPIRVRSRDEVSRVAAALSSVQASAVDLAVEQAVLRRNISDSYINLGRRNQNLLTRQLDFITELERNEADPDALEGLFRLDHLATRMRRNAESLLVLAGVEPPRQWSAPLKLADVVRAALGEVEDYQRVVIRHLEPASVTGAVAADLAHVLAELIENALSFSPPEQTVEVKGRLTTDGYTIAVTDNGIGMSVTDLERANRRLAGLESFTVAPSRYLGHYVAGHLATRMNVAVELQNSPAGGVTARVDVPMGLLAGEGTDQRLPSPAAAPSAGTPVEPSAGGPAGALVEPLVVTGQPPVAAESGRPRHAVRSGGRRRRPAPAPTSEAAASAAPTGPEAVGDETPSSTSAALPTSLADWLAPPVVPEPEPVLAPVRDPQPDAQADQAASATTTGGLTRRIAHDEHMADSTTQAEPGWRVVQDEPAGQTADTEHAAAGARGFGGLAITRPAGPSMYSVAASRARAAADVDVDKATTEAMTPSGLTRRVPGAQRPDLPLGPEPDGEPSAPPAPARTTPEDVYSFLSSFQSGVARGLADARADDSDVTTDADNETTEDGR